MPKLAEIAELKSGVSQLRIKETMRDDAPVYLFYGQSELECDLIDEESSKLPSQTRTDDKIDALSANTLVFNLISNKCSIVRSRHAGYILTQNFVKISPSPHINARFLAYLLNEDEGIQRQLKSGHQGSATIKTTVRQLSNLELPDLPLMEVQEAIGDLYFSQLRLAALKTRLAHSEMAVLKMKLKEACNNG